MEHTIPRCGFVVVLTSEPTDVGDLHKKLPSLQDGDIGSLQQSLQQTNRFLVVARRCPVLNSKAANGLRKSVRHGLRVVIAGNLVKLALEFLPEEDQPTKSLEPVNGAEMESEKAMADEARELAEARHWNLTVIETAEFEQEAFLKNEADRCYHCKTELFDVLHPNSVERVRRGSGPIRPGDLLISMRNVDLIAVVRPGPGELRVEPLELVADVLDVGGDGVVGHDAADRLAQVVVAGDAEIGINGPIDGDGAQKPVAVLDQRVDRALRNTCPSAHRGDRHRRPHLHDCPENARLLRVLLFDLGAVVQRLIFGVHEIDAGNSSTSSAL